LTIRYQEIQKGLEFNVTDQLVVYSDDIGRKHKYHKEKQRRPVRVQ